MEKEKIKFYPNIEYNVKRRTKYFVLFAVLITLFGLMDAWFISAKMWYMLALNAFIILFIVLTPKTLRENPVKREPVLTVGENEVEVMGKKFPISKLRSVKATVYLGKVGNMVENRQFLEKTAAERPPEGMMGMIEFSVEAEGSKEEMHYAVIENVVEALMIFVKEGKVNYKLGYSLDKEYRPCTYNLNDVKTEKPASSSEVSKTKQLI